MKKTVIKRRKRVPAAAGAASPSPSARMTDQAAAEALVAVGRYAAGNGGNGEESDGEAQEPKRKRTRRTRASRVVEKEDEDIPMEGDEEQTSTLNRKRNGWDGRSVSPQNRAPSRSDYMSRGPNAAGPFAPTGSPHSGFEIPPLAVLGNSAAAAALLNAQSSYIRSGSNAPSRTHSPLGHGSASYPLPPGPQFYPPDMGMINFSLAVGNLMSMGIPTVADLERHYMELGEQKRRMEELLERTDRVMAGLKRGLDEMRGASAQQQAPPMPPPAQPAAPQDTTSQAPEPEAAREEGRSQTDAQPAPQPEPEVASSEPERTRDSVWPVVEETSAD
jgi:GATA-binding protein